MNYDNIFTDEQKEKLAEIQDQFEKSQLVAMKSNAGSMYLKTLLLMKKAEFIHAKVVETADIVNPFIKNEYKGATKQKQSEIKNLHNIAKIWNLEIKKLGVEIEKNKKRIERISEEITKISKKHS